MSASHPVNAARGLTLGLGLILAGAALGQPTALPLPPPPMAPAPPSDHGRPSDDGSSGPHGDDAIQSDYTVQQREDRLKALLDTSLADGSIDRADYQRYLHELDAIHQAESRMRARHHGELTDADTFRLEGNLKALAANIRGPR